MQSNAPVPNNLYPLANGLTSSGPLLTVIKTVDPTPYDIQYSVHQRWINTSLSNEWILLGFTITAGVTQANWLQLSSGQAIEEFTGGTGTTGFPVIPNSAGQVQLTSLDQSVLLTGSTNSIDFSIAFRLNIITQTTPGNYTYTPTPGMKYCLVEVVGGGGGGGGAHSVAGINQSCGAGGGAGGYGRGIFSLATIGISKPYLVGAGGLAGDGTTGGTGGTGGTSDFGAFITCTGGIGGAGSAADSVNGVTVGGVGGIPSGIGLAFGINYSSSRGGAGWWINSGATFVAYSGEGASGFFGPGGSYGILNGAASSVGGAGLNGGGGGGAIQSNAGAGTSHNGGVGGSGVVIITEYIFKP